MTKSTDADPQVKFAAGTAKDDGAVPSKKNLPKEGRAIVANARNDITIPFFSNVLQPNDDTIIKRGRGKGLALYDEIERDTHAWAVLQKRKKVLVAREWEVLPGGEDQRDLDAAKFVEAQLAALPFDRICEDLLDATLKGFAVSEIVWARVDNQIVAERVLNHDQRRFTFDFDWKLRLLTKENMAEGIALPERKFIVHRHGVKGNNPFGLGLGTRLFWPTLFKREGVAFWLTFLDKFAAPTVVGKVPFGLTEEQEADLLASLSSAAKQASILVPMGSEVDMLEASRSGSVSYEAWCKYWDSQFSICVLGETLTTDVQDKGSRAAGEVHADMLQMLIDADADLLSNTLHETLVEWLVAYNFPGAKLPTVWRLRPANEQAEATTQEKQSKAAGEREKAIRQIVGSSAQFTDDNDAREYIQTLAPGNIDAEMLDRLVAVRFSFADASKASDTTDPKKKELTTTDNDRSDTAGFAEAAGTSDADIQDTLTVQLETFGEEWDANRISQVLAVLDAATDLEDAAKKLLVAGTQWSAQAYAGTVALALNASAYAGRDAVLGELDDAAFADVDAFNQPFQEQIDFFSQKSPRPTAEWTDIMRGDHDRAFVIAGAKDLDMLTDFQGAIHTAIKDGGTLESFRKDFDKIVAKYGWSYNGERGWRTRVIFETNVRTSYMAGRLKQMRDPDVIKARPYWQYRHGQTRKPKVARREHLAWNGLILRHDDPFWDAHFPPNDWKCSCGVRTLSDTDLERLGRSGPDETPPARVKTIFDNARGGVVDVPAGLGRGFEYQPGDLWERGLVPSQLDRLATKSAFTVDEPRSIADLIAIGRPIKAKALRPNRPAEHYVNAFLGAFGAVRGKAALFKDKAGAGIPISDELFRNSTGGYKVLKRGREIHAAQLAEAIIDPDEIWVGVSSIPIPADQGGGFEIVIDRKYIRVDPSTGLLAIFELLKGRWSAKTAFKPEKKNSTSTNVNAIDRRRSGVLVYARK